MLVKDRKLLPNAVTPTLYFAEPAIKLVFEFDFDLPTGVDYTLAVDTERTRIITGPMASAVGAVSGKTLTFELSTRTDRFDIQSQKEPEAYIEIHDENETVYLQDRISIAPRVDVGGVPPQQLAQYPTVTVMNEAIAAAETAFLAKSSTFTGTITVQRNFSSLLTVKSTLATGRTGIDYVGTERSFWAGVGNAADTIEALRNCWGVYDVTAAAPRMTINPAGLLWAADISINGTVSLAAKLAQIDAELAAGGGNGYVPMDCDYLTSGMVNLLCQPFSIYADILRRF